MSFIFFLDKRSNLMEKEFCGFGRKEKREEK